MATTEQRVRSYIDELIAGRQLEPGDRLPTERALAEDLAAPRGAIRRALDALVQEGRISRSVGRGTFLVEPARRRDHTAPLSTSPAAIMQARLTIEPAIAAMAARAATQTDLDRLAGHLKEEARTNTFENTETADAKIHREIAIATHNDLLAAVYEVMHTARDLPVWGSLKRRTSTAERRAAYHQKHIEIVSALNDRDPLAAETAMGIHLRDLAVDLLGRPDQAWTTPSSTY